MQIESIPVYIPNYDIFYIDHIQYGNQYAYWFSIYIYYTSHSLQNKILYELFRIGIWKTSASSPLRARRNGVISRETHVHLLFIRVIKISVLCCYELFGPRRQSGEFIDSNAHRHPHSKYQKHKQYEALPCSYATLCCVDNHAAQRSSVMKYGPETLCLYNARTSSAWLIKIRFLISISHEYDYRKRSFFCVWYVRIIW